VEDHFVSNVKIGLGAVTCVQHLLCASSLPSVLQKIFQLCIAGVQDSGGSACAILPKEVP
jgi:hypothetical protein